MFITTINCTLILFFIFSFIKFLQNFNKYSISNIDDCLKQRDNLIEKLRIDCLKQTIKSDYFSLMYFSIIGNKQMIKIAQQQLLNLGIDKNIVNDLNKLNNFINEIFSGKINIIYNPNNKSFKFNK